MTRMLIAALTFTVVGCAPDALELQEGEALRLVYDDTTGVVVRPAPGMDYAPGLDEDGKLRIEVVPPSNSVIDPVRDLPDDGRANVYMGTEDGGFLLDAIATWIDYDQGLLVAEGPGGEIRSWTVE